jgi:hypothetical protein
MYGKKKTVVVSNVSNASAIKYDFDLSDLTFTDINISSTNVILPSYHINSVNLHTSGTIYILTDNLVVNSVRINVDYLGLVDTNMLKCENELNAVLDKKLSIENNLDDKYNEYFCRPFKIFEFIENKLEYSEGYNFSNTTINRYLMTTKSVTELNEDSSKSFLIVQQIYLNDLYISDSLILHNEIIHSDIIVDKHLKKIELLNMTMKKLVLRNSNITNLIIHNCTIESNSR